jgi:hypothetical protein
MLYTISSEQVDVFFENIKNNSLLMDPIRVQLNSDNSEFYYNYGWESREKRKVIVFDPKNNRNLRVIFEGPTNNSSKTTLSMVYTKSNMVLEKNSQDSDAKKIFESFVSQVHVLSEKKLNELQTTESDPKLPQDDSLIRKISTTTWNEGIKKMKQLNCSNISLRAFNETCKCEISVFGRNISFILDWGVYYFKWVDDQESKTTISLDNNKPCVLSTENIPKLACFLDNFIKAVSAYYDL